MNIPHRHIITVAAAAFLALGAPTALAMQADDPGGMLRTMPRGTYECALPGDAGGPAFRVVESEAFRITSASRYESAEGAGTYILRGREMAFTRGPRKGERFERIGANQLRKLGSDGEMTALLCTRLGSR